MRKYLKLFKTHQEYGKYVGGEMILPNVSHCIEENHVHYNPIPHNYSKDYLTFVALEDGTFKFTSGNNNVISYSLDEGKTWTELVANASTPTVTRGKTILWKGEMTPLLEEGIGTFSSTGRIDVQGNVMSLLYGNNFEGQTDLTGKDGAFVGLFSSVGGICGVVNANNLILPATTLAEDCYGAMFTICPTLVTAPELPATTLADSCYSSMFRGCRSLATVPELPATTLADRCYNYMFFGCKSLTTAPELSATTLAIECYHVMFGNCTSLVNAPELPAKTLAGSCYSGMFDGCTSLTTAPELPATTLAEYCYTNMFKGCTGLVNAPELPATTLAEGCYGNMFDGCTNLNYIKAMFTTTPSTTYTDNWVNGVASSGTFVKECGARWNVAGVNGIPEGWTVEYQQANGEPCQGTEEL